MKKKSLNLSELKVKSFVTNPTARQAKTVKGGSFMCVTFVGQGCGTVGCASDGCQTEPEVCMATADGCQAHTAAAHLCSDAGCYSNFCNSTECNGNMTSNCPV